MKIVVLSEPFAVNPVLDNLKELGEVFVYDDTTSEELTVERCKDAEIAILCGYVTPTTHEVLDQLTSVKLIIVDTTGYEFIDVSYAKSRGIMIANVSGFGTEAVAEEAIALLFAASRNVVVADKDVRNGVFEIDPQDSKYEKYLGNNLLGKTLGVIGLGAIGTQVAKLGRALGMNVIAYNRSEKSQEGIELVTLEDLLQRSDYVSINLALNDDTKHLIGEKELSLMKRTSIIINTARGAIIDEIALYNTLANRNIRGAGLDVLENRSVDNPILKLDNVVLAPHIGFYTDQALQNIANIILEEVRCYINGSPINILEN